MKNLTMLIWLTQLGLSVAAPVAGCVWLAIWLRDCWGWGDWIVIVGIVVGITGAVDGLRDSLKAMERLSRREPRKEEPPVSFNDHE